MNLDCNLGAEFILLSLNVAGGGYWFCLKDVCVHITLLCSSKSFLIFLSLLLPTSYSCTQTNFSKNFKYLYNVALSSNESSQLKLWEASVRPEQNSLSSGACRHIPETTVHHNPTFIETTITGGFNGIKVQECKSCSVKTELWEQ